MSRRKKSSAAEKIIALNENKYKLYLKNFELTKKQHEFLKIAFDKNTKIIFVSGPAGSSKTFVSIYAALQLFNMNMNQDIFYVRTIAESGEKNLGSLPGDVDEKFHPFMMPLQDKLEELLEKEQIKMLIDENIIQCAPINYLRGASWANKLIIADESQNFTRKELVTLITRIGENSKYFICGDPMQSDINGKTGFAPIMEIFDNKESREKGIYTFKFTDEDIVRSEILKFIVNKLENNPSK
jgi:phosphate starvation-inducible PhoH-like protein